MLLSPCVQELKHEPAARVLQASVLIVDDDENFRDLARRLLEASGFDVIEACTVEQCFRQLRRYAVDVVIMDIVMPDRDGLEALKDIKALSPSTRIVTVSGALNSPLFLATSAHLGADASLDKSKIALLSGLVNVVLER
jgi:DNA-binding NarL/FixJ family response regulator